MDLQLLGVATAHDLLQFVELAAPFSEVFWLQQDALILQIALVPHFLAELEIQNRRFGDKRRHRSALLGQLHIEKAAIF